MKLGLSLGLSAQNAVAAAPAFAPTDISGLVWWLRADLGVSLVGGVDSWADQSGVGDTARNASASGFTRPAYVASDPLYNGKPTIGPFSATATTKLRTGALWNATYPTYSIIVVGHCLGTSNRYFCLPSATNYAALVNKAGVANIFSGTTPLETTSGAKTMNNPTYALLEFNYSAGSNGKIFVGQTAVADGSRDISAEPISLGALGLYVGSHPNANVIFAIEQAAEYIVYNKILSAPEKVQIASYMARYGL